MMINLRSKLLYFFFAVLLAIPLSVGLSLGTVNFIPTAAAQSQASDIDKAYFPTGWFERRAHSEWTEFDGAGNIRFTFKETGRNDSSIFLYLKQYGVKVEIDAKGRQIFAEWPGRPRHVMHRITNMSVTPPTIGTPPAPPTLPPPLPPTSNISTANIAAAVHSGGEFIKAGPTWTETTASGARYTFRELGHDDRHVYLYDNSRAAFVIMDLPGRKIRYSNGGTVRDLYDVTEFSQVSPVDPVSPPTLPPPPPPPPNSGGNPQSPTLSTLERATCIATGGKVERAGLLGAERCTRPYRDAGQVCTDSSQCQGQCRVGTDGANQSSITGTCQANDSPFGCYAEVVNGTTGPALCAD